MQIEVKLKLKSLLWEEEIYRGQTPQNLKLKIFLKKKQQNEHTPAQNGALTYFLKENKFLLCIFINDDNLQIIKY